MKRKEPVGKGKTVQLGQNQLNSRRLKEKIEELKRLGVMITLWSFIIVIGNNKFNTYYDERRRINEFAKP